MERRPLGLSGVVVPVVGFGCGGSARLMVGDDRAAQVEAVQAALDSGIDYFDTAPAYGAGRSETNLGSVLAHLGSPPVTISTKVVLDEEQLDRPRDAMLRSVEASLRRLGRERVDMLLLHNRVARSRAAGERVGVGPVIGLADVFDPGGVADGFQELLDTGTISACGITAFGGEPAAVREVLRSGIPTVINAALSLLEPTSALAVPPPGGGADHGQVISAADELGIGVIAIRVFGSGRLLQAVDDPVNGAVRRLATELGAGDAYLGSLAFALGTPGVGSAVIGFSEAAHVHAAVAASRAAVASRIEASVITERLAEITSLSANSAVD